MNICRSVEAQHPQISVLLTHMKLQLKSLCNPVTAEVRGIISRENCVALFVADAVDGEAQV